MDSCIDTSTVKRRKRVITTARKEQNRIAQQLYRQRQKSQVPIRSSRPKHSARYHELRPRPRTQPVPCEQINPDASIPQVRTSLDVLLDTGAEILQPSNSFHASPQDGELNTNELFPVPLDTASLITGDFGCAVYASEASMVLTPITSMDESNAMTGYSVTGLILPEINNTSIFSMSWPGWIDNTASVPVAQPSEFLERALEPAVFPLSPIQGIDWCQLSGMLPESLGYVADEILRCIPIDDPLRQIPGIETLVSSTAKFISMRHPVLSRFPHLTRPEVSLPDPYANVITPSLVVTLEAFFQNSLCIGLSISDLLSHQSSFYNPTARASDDPLTLLATARKPWIPSQLQPTLPQILIPHHPFLDLLPFPALRDRAITLGAMKPSLFCPMELKRDVLQDGIFFSRGAESRGAERGNKVPWDLQAWRTAPWFVSKWKLLLG